MRRLIGAALLVALACGCNPPADQGTTSNSTTTTTMAGSSSTTTNATPESGSPAVATSGSPVTEASGSPAVAASGSPAANANGPAGKTVKLPDGLEYEDQVVGTGPEAKAGDKVSVQYTGTLTNGEKFDSTADHGGAPFTFTLGVHQVIAGWDEGVAGMKKGGKRHLVIPAALGYGDRTAGKIPANSTLVFDVELVNINGQ